MTHVAGRGWGYHGAVHHHQNAFDLLGLDPPPASDAALAMIDACERRCGRVLPAAVREWFAYTHVTPRTRPLDDGGFNYGSDGYLWYDWTNDDHPLSLEELLAHFEAESPRGGRVGVAVLAENQGNGEWIVELGGSDDPPVWCTYDWGSEPAWEEAGDDDGAATDPQAARERPLDDDDGDDDGYDEEFEDDDGDCTLEYARFSDFVFASFLASYSTHASLGSHVGHAYRHTNRLWFRAPRAAAVGPEALARISAALGPARSRRTACGATSHRFLDGVRAEVHLVTDEPGTPGARASWWVWADSAASLAALFRQVVPLGGLARTARVETDEARKALAEALAAGALAPTREVRRRAPEVCCTSTHERGPLDTLTLGLTGYTLYARAVPGDEGEATRRLAALWSAASAPGPLVRALQAGGDVRGAMLACVACCRRAVALVDDPHRSTLGAAVDAVARAVDGAATAAGLDELERTLARDVSPGEHPEDHGEGARRWLDLDVRYVEDLCPDARLRLAQRAVLLTLQVAARVARGEVLYTDYTASGAVDAAHHALWLGDARTGATRAGKELADEVRGAASPPSAAQVRAETERKRARK